MFLHPWAIVLGVLAAALPVAVHWLTRPKPVRLPLSTLRFVREAVRQRRTRHRLRDVLVLALRTLAVLLLAAAVARPFVAPRESATTETQADVLRVVVLDVSQSMAAQARGVRLFERARALAAQELQYQPWREVNLIPAGAQARAVFATPSTNFAALQDALAQSDWRPERLNVSTALDAAAEMLGQSDAAADGVERELVIVSDFQRTNWATANFAGLPADTEIRLRSVAPARAPANLAVLHVSAQGRAEVGHPVRLEVDVGNYSATPRQVRVEVTLGDAVYQLQGHCPPNTQTTLTDEILPPQEGWLTGRARLVGLDGSSDVQDALPTDNERPCVLRVRPPPVYALVTRQPETAEPSSSYFLHRALAPYDPSEARRAAQVVRLDPSRLDRAALDTAGLIVLDHPGRLSDQFLGTLASLLRRGRGILYVTSEPVDALNLRALARQAGSELQLPVDFLPPPNGQRRRDLFVTGVVDDQRPFEVFGDQLPSFLEPLRFAGGLATRRVEGTLDDEVLATLSDRSALLVVTSSAAGSLAILNADLAASSLARSPMFVPLLEELASLLLEQGPRTLAYASGEPLAVYLPVEIHSAAGMKLEAVGTDGLPGRRDRAPDPKPESTTGLGHLVPQAAGVFWQMETLGPPGVYRVRRDGQTVFAIASTVPGDESDLRALPAEVFQQRLAGGRSVQFQSTADSSSESTDRTWTWLAMACVVCLFGELMVLKAFRT